MEEERKKLVDLAANQLGEHFEAVQILVSWTEEGYTHSYSHGAGNLYARHGLAQEFRDFDRARIQAKVNNEES